MRPAYFVVVVVLTLTRIIKSVVTGQAPYTPLSLSAPVLTVEHMKNSCKGGVLHIALS